MAHEYEITQNGRTIVSISKEWMTWGDNYELDIANPADEIVALAVVLTIDCVTESNSGVSVTISSNYQRLQPAFNPPQDDNPVWTENEM